MGTRTHSILLTPNLNVKRQHRLKPSCYFILEDVFGQTNGHEFPMSLSMLYFIQKTPEVWSCPYAELIKHYAMKT
jgi:hypothetical protein